ncbi:MAG: hypothetical protein AAF533_26745 [Acidobacteriota bacterium]
MSMPSTLTPQAPRRRRLTSRRPAWQRCTAVLSLLAIVSLLTAPPAQAARPAKKAFRLGQAAAAEGNWDWAVVHFRKAVDLKPANQDYRNSLRNATERASYQHFELAKQLLYTGNLEAAIGELQQTVALNPSHQYAYVELEKALQLWREQRLALDDEALALERAKREANAASGAIPKLDPNSNIPIIWDMEDTTLEDVFRVIQDVANITVIFDEAVRKEEKISFRTDNVSLEQALELLMLQQALAYKVIDEHTLLIYDDNQTKRREYEDQVIRTFYLSNAEVKDVNAMLRGVVDVRKSAVNETLNAITIRDTQDRIAIAGKIIERNDKAKAELVIDMEILEVNRSKMRTFGIDLLSGGESGIRTGIAFDDTQVRLNNLRRLRQLGSYILSPLPSVTMSLIRSDSDTRVLSRPSARVTDGEKVNLHIGDQVPIPNTTFNTSTTSGGNVVPVTSFTYQNVGIQITLEPRVHHNREITLKMQAEISSVGATNTGGQPTIGTREIETVIRLRDGETNLLAGLFQENDLYSHSGVPGLTEVPLLRRIFGSQSKQGTETEIILTVTPHIIRIPDIAATDLGALHVGTERQTRLRGQSQDGVGGSPFAKPNEKPKEELFQALAPGGTLRDRGSMIVPDLGAVDAARQANQESGGSGGGNTLQLPRRPTGAPPVSRSSGAPSAGSSSGSPMPGPAPSSTPAPAPSPAPSSGEGSSLSFEPAEPGGPVQLSLQGPTIARVGQPFTVEVRVDANGHALKNAPYHLLVDSSRVDVESVTEGSFFSRSGSPSVFIHNEQSGRIIVGHSLMGTGEAPTGEGSLAVIQLRPTAPGPLRLRFDRVSFSDRTRDALQVQASELQVQVSP